MQKYCKFLFLGIAIFSCTKVDSHAKVGFSVQLKNKVWDLTKKTYEFGHAHKERIIAATSMVIAASAVAYARAQRAHAKAAQKVTDECHLILDNIYQSIADHSIERIPSAQVMEQLKSKNSMLILMPSIGTGYMR